MGASISQIQAPQTSQSGGKGQQSPVQRSQDYSAPQDMLAPTIMPQQTSGKGGRITYPGQSGQPQMGQPNRYSNTVGQWDNATIGTQPSGKGKGA